MKKNISFLFFASVMLVSVSCFAVLRYIENHDLPLPYYSNATFASEVANVQKKDVAAIPPFSFTDQDGKIVNNSLVDHKVWVADFFFSRCGSVCPKMNQHLQQVQKVFSGNNNFKIVSFTCDPKNDTPRTLNRYAERYTSDHVQWLFVTGNKERLYHFARKGLGIVATEGDGGVNDFIHSQNLVLIDKQGYIRGYYDGLENNSVNQLILDIKKIL